MRALLRTLGIVVLLATLASTAFASATINIINTDGAGEGFNDPTPAAPVGGNPGTTIGQQRLNCFTHAAAIWGGILTSAVPIQIQAAFNPLTCNATSAVLGSAGPITVNANNPSFEFQGYWYHQALANKEAGLDLDGGSTNDINAQFNSNLGQPACLAGSGWYYGFDHNEGTLIDLVDVLLHEFGHGLGFSTTTSGTTGNFLNGPPALPAVWDKFLFDETTALHWDQMTPAQRVASAINTNNLTWDGGQVKFAGPLFLSHAPELVVPFGSGSLAGSSASFGPALTQGGLSGQAVVVVDNTAPTSDACEAITNGAALAGKIAVVDRGVCTFVFKVKAVQNAGAIGCILINNTTGPFSPGGSDPTITIPTIAILQTDGTSLKTAISGGPTTVTMRLSPTKQAGLSANGRVLMYAPNPFQNGSSVSHWDVTATPNLLMEPAINPDLTDSIDLTDALFRDIGWLPRTLSVPGGGPVARVALAGWPNPGYRSTNLHFELATDETVELSLFDLTGRQVRSLAKAAFAAGPHDVAWDGLDNAGHRAAPGVYLARLKGPRTQATQHLVLMN
jgi:PA domain-containing protein/flagellar hook capping protein FlgD